MRKFLGLESLSLKEAVFGFAATIMGVVMYIMVSILQFG